MKGGIYYEKENFFFINLPVSFTGKKLYNGNILILAFPSVNRKRNKKLNKRKRKYEGKKIFSQNVMIFKELVIWGIDKHSVKCIDRCIGKHSVRYIDRCTDKYTARYIYMQVHRQIHIHIHKQIHRHYTDTYKYT